MKSFQIVGTALIALFVGSAYADAPKATVPVEKVEVKSPRAKAVQKRQIKSNRSQKQRIEQPRQLRYVTSPHRPPAPVVVNCDCNGRQFEAEHAPIISQYNPPPVSRWYFPHDPDAYPGHHWAGHGWGWGTWGYGAGIHFGIGGHYW